MNNIKTTTDFISKFNELSLKNQEYIIAIQQALTFAQTSDLNAEKTTKEFTGEHNA